jgi:hypothetical protein
MKFRKWQGSAGCKFGVRGFDAQKGAPPPGQRGLKPGIYANDEFANFYRGPGEPLQGAGEILIFFKFQNSPKHLSSTRNNLRVCMMPVARHFLRGNPASLALSSPLR